MLKPFTCFILLNSPNDPTKQLLLTILIVLLIITLTDEETEACKVKKLAQVHIPRRWSGQNLVPQPLTPRPTMSKCWLSWNLSEGYATVPPGGVLQPLRARRTPPPLLRALRGRDSRPPCSLHGECLEKACVAFLLAHLTPIWPRRYLDRWWWGSCGEQRGEASLGRLSPCARLPGPRQSRSWPRWCREQHLEGHRADNLGALLCWLTQWPRM